MIRWVVADARARLEDTTRPRVIRTSVEEHRADLRADYQAAGFTVGRSFAEMARPLVDLPEPRALPDGIHVLAWSDRFTESARAASNEAFADHWGSLPMNSEEWRGFTVDSPTFRSDLSFVALSGEQVVSFCIAEVDDEDNAERDADDVYINRVGTVTSHRGHGIASHLIVRTLQAAAVSGELDRAALDVDEASHTNATLVYERLGFTTEARSLSYLIELDA
jgi:ribosomal protein S18 acetylase RimI-like enzyme